MDWKSTAIQTAKQENIKLQEQHWVIIEMIRDFYSKYNVAPSMRAIVKFIQSQHNLPQADSSLLYELFPGGIAQAIKIAGIPDNGRCM